MSGDNALETPYRPKNYTVPKKVLDLHQPRFREDVSWGGVKETLKAIMKRLDAIEERLMPIQSLEERLTALEISIRSPLGRQELPAACVPAHTPEQGQDGGRRDFRQADRGEVDQRGPLPRSQESRHRGAGSDGDGDLGPNSSPCRQGGGRQDPDQLPHRQGGGRQSPEPPSRHQRGGQWNLDRDGNCIVHDMFGHEVVAKIKEQYCDAFLTAHFEVPGEMFSLSMEAKMRGMGVVGSTQNILDFIKSRLKEALNRNIDDHLQFVLGTESGMITSIVASVRELFDSYRFSQQSANIEVEIVFPVSSDAVSNTSISGSNHLDSLIATDLDKLSVVPGVSSGEGCSIHGGCASCPYMKVSDHLFSFF
ncbi:hypothetical protein GUJ93_ZPchr0009g2051 [Zizania palustris]|uniref:Quinolinate synthase n=1 Tax=Zizania palustris TaxID=103762 RepID=A0A8J5RQF9_ZIZPA|nr:hypothetical protein GUJ93_ZPchr0009g2051 [Zizania palustris]KAG8048461.1 hypothetical protein GUJ93_ZPchr0009g2051 [Zizania palustris]